MVPYREAYPVGTRVRVRRAEALRDFRCTWRGHHPLTEAMIERAGSDAVVTQVGFYHGGDPLYQLGGLPGTWHEACLEPY